MSSRALSHVVFDRHELVLAAEVLCALRQTTSCVVDSVDGHIHIRSGGHSQEEW